MPTPSTTDFHADEVQLAAFAKALAHPARIAILKRLAEQRGCLCGEIVEVLPLAQATVSQHLKALKEAGLIRGETDGPRCCYSLNADVMQTFEQSAIALFDMLHIEDSCC